MPFLTHSLAQLAGPMRRFFSPNKARKTVQLIDYSNIHALNTALQAWPVGVTEVVASGMQELGTLLPFLASVTRKKKWVVLVAPPYAPPMPRLLRAGIDPDRFMVVRARSPEGKAWAVQQALRSHDCGAVLFWSQPLEAGRRLRLEAAAVEGEASCIGFIESFNHLIPIRKAA